MAEQRDRAVFVISVAAELAGVHPQTLRIYEREGLVRPKRTTANARRYSERDIERLLEIKRLTSDGMNLEGVRRVIPLTQEIERLQASAGRARGRAAGPGPPPPPGARDASAGRPGGTWSPTPRPSSATSTPPPDTSKA